MKKKVFWICVIIFILVGVRAQRKKATPFLDSPIPLGYDPGIYKGIHDTYQDLSGGILFGTLPKRIKHEPLWGVWSNTMESLGVSIDQSLIRGIWFVGLFIALSATFLLAPKNIFAMTITFALFSVSIIQYETFFMNYYKQLLASCLMLCCIFLWIQKKYRRLGLTIIVTALLHRHTTLYLGLTLGLTILGELFFLRKIERKKVFILAGAVIITILLYGPLLQLLIGKFINPLLTTTGGSGLQGIFFSSYEFWWFEIFILPFAYFALVMRIYKKQRDPIDAGLILGTIWTLGALLNYQRGLVFFDIFVILSAVRGVHLIYDRQRRVGMTTGLFVVLINCIYFFGYRSENHSPLISPTERESLSIIPQQTPQDSVVLVTSSYYAPRVAGYTYRARISPGLSDTNKRDFEQRQSRRANDGNGKCDMLAKDYPHLNKKLYRRYPLHQQPSEDTKGYCFKTFSHNESVIIYLIDFSNNGS